jgi:hypothetical protein
MKSVFLAWQDPASRRWLPIGRLVHDSTTGAYQFAYTKGAETAAKEYAFQPLASFPQLDRSYESNTLFPLFANRMPSPTRSDYDDYVTWLNLPKHDREPIAVLARMGGRRATDSFEIFPCPEGEEEKEYRIHFFAHGLRHMSPGSIERISRLKEGEPLLLLRDFQNPHDGDALLLRTDTAAPECPYPDLVGYCPRYLVEDALKLLESCPSSLRVRVERINLPPAPLQLRLLCEMTGCWPNGFRPFAGPMYQLLLADKEADSLCQ